MRGLHRQGASVRAPALLTRHEQPAASDPTALLHKTATTPALEALGKC